MPRAHKNKSTWVQIEARSEDAALVQCPLDVAALPAHISGDGRTSVGIMAATLLLQTRKLDIADEIVQSAWDGDTAHAWELIEQYQRMPRV